ncbi:MAG: Mur ligase family protein, partial [Acidobacteria bacterium]|nr:Mur ligase family protein [Acidobacteriota bacterium]
MRYRFWRLRVRLKSGLLFAAAFLWRGLLFRTTFVAITGSVGKTTAKDCLAGILSARFPIVHTDGSYNEFRDLARTILRVRPGHRFAVLEVATDRPGCMWHMGRLARPDIAVVLRVAREYSG